MAEHWSPDDELFVFFNNDPGGCAVRDAVRFAEALSRAGFTPSRVPVEDEVTVG